MIYVLTGNGKGKTTSALGMGIRAAGAGRKVLMVQFLKTGDSSESKVIKRIKNFKIRSFGRKGFGPYGKKDFLLAERGLDFFEKEIKNYRMVILDEVNVALSLNLINVKEVLPLLGKYGRKADIVLTGRRCPAKIMEKADLVTEFKEIKHYFKKGVKARKGIEY